MNKKIIILSLAFFLISTTAVAYLGVLGNLTLEEIQKEVVVEEEVERNARGLENWPLENGATKVDIIKYPHPDLGYGPLGEHQVVDAFKYYYPDGTTEIVSETDGTVLKKRQ